MLSPTTPPLLSSLLSPFSVVGSWFASAPHFLLRKKAPVRLVPGTVSTSIFLPLVHRLSACIKLASTIRPLSLSIRKYFFLFSFSFFLFSFLTGNLPISDTVS